ncbi:MAG: AzlD domain-containing protein [Clostridiales bacterium]|jgi:branched-subunit amino acid transport protein|nr:AzlD domain-containing protein [Clostridiales bacterium]
MNIYILIFLMMLVTYIPRALPALTSEKIRLSAYWEKFLGLIPYTAIAALVFPGILSVDHVRPAVGIAGGITAVAAAWFKLPVFAVVALSVAAELLIYLVV